MMFTTDKQEAFFHQATAYYNAARVLFIPDRDREFNSIHVFDIDVVLTAIDILLDAARCKIIEQSK
jgi:hypothetical protein